MDWLESKIAEWLVSRIFRAQDWQRKMDDLNGLVVSRYESVFTEDNHLTMCFNLRERFEASLQASKMRMKHEHLES